MHGSIENELVVFVQEVNFRFTTLVKFSIRNELMYAIVICKGIELVILHKPANLIVLYCYHD